MTTKSTAEKVLDLEFTSGSKLSYRTKGGTKNEQNADHILFLVQRKYKTYCRNAAGRNKSRYRSYRHSKTI